MNENPSPLCPRCGTVLLPGASGGVCPRCAADFLQGTETGVTGQPGGRLFTPPAPSELASKFPQLEILELLGRGGMGAVYKARQKRLDRLVALKILPPGIGDDPAFAERFTREARALAKLQHPNIVTLYEFGEADGLFYFLMEFMDGVNLRQLLNTGRIKPKEALAIVPQICDALQFAHDRGIVHRDIKPENVLLNKEGQVKIADFGVAKIMSGETTGAVSGSVSAPDPGRTEAGKILGTPQYMAPEQLSNPLEVDNRADIYSLGVVFYQMLTGELPTGKFEAPSRKVQIDVRLDEVVLRALEKQPELRYQQASIFKTQVETIAQTPPPPAADDSAPKPQVDSGVEGRAMLARQAVKIPAIGLMVFAAVKLLALLVAVTALRMKFSLANAYAGPGAPQMDFIMWPGILLFGTLGGYILVAARRMMQLRGFTRAVCAAILVIVLSLGCFFTPSILIPLGLLGLTFGVWALVVLNHREVKDAFAECAKNPSEKPSRISEPHFSRTAIVGACWIPFFFVALLLWFVSADPVVHYSSQTVGATEVLVPRAGVETKQLPQNKSPETQYIELSPSGTSNRGEVQVTSGTTTLTGHSVRIWMPDTEAAQPATPAVTYAGSEGNHISWLAFLVFAPLALAGLTAPFGSTILGCVAISQIRRSGGKLRGLGLAWFDALFFPLLALDGLVLGFCFVAITVWNKIHPNYLDDNLWILIWLLLTAALSAWVDFLIIRRVWRAAKAQEEATIIYEPPSTVPTPPVAPPQGKHWFGTWLVRAVYCVAALAALWPVIGLAADFHDPNHLERFAMCWAVALGIAVAGKLLSLAVEGLSNSGRSGPVPGNTFAAALPTIAWHGALLLAMLGFFAFVVPRFKVRFDSFEVPLPPLTMLTLTLSSAIKRSGLLLFPLLLALDAGICILTQNLAGRRLRRLWSAMVICVFGGIVLTAGISLRLPILVSEQTTSSENLSFGPLVEQTIYLSPNPDSFFSIDTGKFVPPPEDFDTARGSEPDVQKLWTWLTDHDVDFFAQRISGKPRLTMADMVYGNPLAESEFDRLSPAQVEHDQGLQNSIAANIRGSLTFPGNIGSIGNGFAMVFQTRSKVTGLVQVTGVTSDPPGVKIRYKLVEHATMSSSEMARLANTPFELQKLPTPKVIQVGIAHPLLPWAWQELDRRQLTAADCAQILDNLTVWLRRDHPQGFSEPMAWLDTFLDQLRKRNLVTDEQAIRFMQALEGDLRCEPRARLREGARSLDLNIECRYIWTRAPLGLVMMNELRSATVDGKPLALTNHFANTWDTTSLHDNPPLPSLAPGEHKVTLEVVSALVPEADLAGLPQNAPSSDWPPAKKRWTRTAEMTLLVLPRDAEIVGRTQDYALDPATSGGLSVKQVIIRPKGDRAQAVLVFDLNARLPVNISFDAALRIGGRTIPCGSLWACKGHDGQITPYSGEELTADLELPAPEIKEADVILTPNPKYVENIATVDRIWGKDVDFNHVPLTRQDTAQTTPTVPGSNSKTWTAPLPQGTLSLVAISRHPSDGAPWWKPDGSPSTEGPFTNPSSHSYPGADEQAREFVFRAQGLPPGVSSLVWKFDPSSGGSVGGGAPDFNGKPAEGYYIVATALPKSASTVTVKAGLATDTWEAIAETWPVGSNSMSTQHGNLDWSLSFTEPVEKADKSTVITVSYSATDGKSRAPVPPSDQQARIIAVDDQGHEHTAARTDASDVGSATQLTATFSDLPMGSIKTIRLQARPYHWVEFHNVALNPNPTAAPLPATPLRNDTILARNVRLNFADPEVRDGSFRTQQHVAFAASFVPVKDLPVLADVFTIGQNVFTMSLQGDILEITGGKQGGRIATYRWPTTEERFDKVVTVPVQFGDAQLSCPVQFELQRRKDGPPFGWYWYCAWLSGTLPSADGERAFEIVNLDQQMRFRNSPIEGAGEEAVLGIDLDGDGRISANEKVAELYAPFLLGTKRYRLTEIDPAKLRVAFRKVVDSEVPESNSSTGSVTPITSAEPPQLRFLAWQDENTDINTNHWRAWHPDVSPVENPDEMKLIDRFHPAFEDVSGTAEGKKNPRFLFLWFSHPGIDEDSFKRVTLFDAEGKPLAPGTGAYTYDSKAPDDSNGNTGWIDYNLSPGYAGHIPASVTIRLEYSTGPWTREREIPSDYNGTMSLGGHVMLGLIGQNADGHAFISITRSDMEKPDTQYSFIALLRDGRELKHTGFGGGGYPNLTTETSTFPVALAEVKAFRLRTSPIKTVEFKNVPLQAGAQTPAAEPPQLRFLAWQDESTKNELQGWRAWHPDGTPVKDPDELKTMATLRDSNGMAAQSRNAKNPHFLWVWISHPSFSKDCKDDVLLENLDDHGEPLQYHGGSTSVEPGWFTTCVDFSDFDLHIPGIPPVKNVGHMPKAIKVNLVYTVDPWKTLAENIPAVTATPYVSLGDVMLGSVGQNAQGMAFISLIRTGTPVSDTEYNFVPVTKDGSKPDISTVLLMSGPKQLKTETSQFSVKLADVDHFLLRSRPIKTVEFKNVPLQAGAQTPTAGQPQLRFLGWQDEHPSWDWDKGGVWDSTGQQVETEVDRAILRRIRPEKENLVYMPGGKETRVLSVWFSHQDFGAESLAAMTIQTPDGHVVPAFPDSNDGFVQPPSAGQDGTGWSVENFAAATGTKLPPLVNVQLRYSAGAWSYAPGVRVPASGDGIVNIESAQINQTGQTSGGKAFVSMVRNATKTPDTQFSFEALATDGRTLEPSSRSSSGGDTARTERFEFELPINQVKEFRLRSRPVKTVEFKNVPLQTPGLSYGPEVKGLRAALELIPSGQVVSDQKNIFPADGNFHLGEPIDMRFYVLNISTKENIYVSGGSWRQDGTSSITVEDAQGKAVPVRNIWYSGITPIQRNYLQPGEVAEFHSSSLAFLPEDADENSVTHLMIGHYVKVKPGRYIVRCKLRFPDIVEGNKPQPYDWQGELDTAPVTVSVTEAEKSTPPQAPTPGQAATPAFGPVVERVMQGSNWALNLASGNVVTAPQSPDSLRAEKADVYHPMYANSPHTLVSLDMLIVPLGDNGWDTPVADVVARLKEASRSAIVAKSDVWVNALKGVAFRTREGAYGVMQIIKADTFPATFRYKLVQNGGTPQAEPPATPAATEQFSFDPLVERVIQGDGKDCWALNLASGKVIKSTKTHPLDFRMNGADTLRAADVDLYQPIYANSSYSLKALDTLFVPLGPKGWELSAADVAARLKDAGDSWTVGRSDGFLDGSKIFAFKTRNGTQGVLQVKSDISPATLRYKLVKASSAPSQTASTNAPPASLPGKFLANKEQIKRIELLIKDAPVTTELLAPLFETTPGPKSVTRIRAEVVAIPVMPAEKSGVDVPLGQVFDLPASKVFYIQWDAMGASTLHFYGPFDGDPAAKLGLKPVPADVKPAPGTGASHENASVPIQVAIYELLVPPEKAARLSAGSLSSAAATQADFDKALADAGAARLLYRTDQSINLAGDNITFGDSVPFVVSSAMDVNGKRVNIVQYGETGAILKVAGQITTEGISADINVELATVIGNSALPTTNDFINTTLGYKGPMTPDKPVVAVNSNSGAPAADGKTVVYVARIAMGKPRSSSAPAPVTDTNAACPLQATIYELHLPAESIVGLDAANLAGLAADPVAFEAALSKKGDAKALYRIDQPVKFAGDRVLIENKVPMTTHVSPSVAGREVKTFHYQSLGAILNFKGSPETGDSIAVELALELSAMNESTVDIAPNTPAALLRKDIMNYKGPVTSGKPVVILNVDAGTPDAAGNAVAYIARIVVNKPAPAAQEGNASAFGPTVNVELNAQGFELGKETLRWSDGKVFDLPEHFDFMRGTKGAMSLQEQERWLLGTKVNFVMDYPDANHWAMGLRNMKLAETPVAIFDAWASLSAADLQKLLPSLQWKSVSYLNDYPKTHNGFGICDIPKGTPAPLTYIYETSDGDFGLFQIVSFPVRADAGPVKLRYKLAKAKAGAAATPAPGPSQPSPLAKLPPLDKDSAKGLVLKAGTQKPVYTVGEKVFVDAEISNPTGQLTPIGWNTATGNHFVVMQGEKITMEGLLPQVIPEMRESLTVGPGMPDTEKVLYLPPGHKVSLLLDCGKAEKPGAFRVRVGYDPLMPRNGWVSDPKTDNPPWLDQVLVSDWFEYKVEAAKDQPAQPETAAAFGPVNEQIVTTNDAGNDGLVFFDMETGKFFKPPFALKFHPGEAPAFVEFTPELKEWIKANGVDVLFHLGEKSWDMLTLEMQEDIAGQPTEWNKVIPEAVRNIFLSKDAAHLVLGDFPASSFGHGYRDGPGACNAFRTRTGTMGVYQLEGIDDTARRGVRIHYKLVKNAAPTPSPAAISQ